MNANVTVQTIVQIISETYRENVQLDPSTLLQELPGFDSLFLTILIDQLEERLQQDLQPQYLIPETFKTPMTLYQAFQNQKRGD